MTSQDAERKLGEMADDLERRCQDEVARASELLRRNEVTHLAQLEAAGKQAFIFATNRLRENIGGSALLGDSCSGWVYEATGRRDDADVVAQTSGRALLAGTEDGLRAVIEDVTKRVLVEAPGLTVTGSITQWNLDEDSDEASALGAAMHRLTEANEQTAGRLPASLSRFRRLPPVADCAVSSYPAEYRRRIGDSDELASEVSYRKHLAGTQAWDQRSREFIDRLGRQSEQTTQYRFSQNLDSLADALLADPDSDTAQRRSGETRSDAPFGWLTVVHIDGSGVGKLFIEQSAQAAMSVKAAGNHQSATDRHLELYFALSVGLDEATKAAFTAALAAVARPDGLIPVVPLVVGGDDVTAVCLGRDALRFIEAYLSTFETFTAPIAARLKQLMHAGAAVPDRFSACAGLAFVKPHYPFHLAYGLAEELISSAKMRVKQTVSATEAIPSAYDMHVLNDSSAVSLADIRDQRRSRVDDIELWGGPYVVGAVPEGSTLRTHDWLISAIEGVASITAGGSGDDADRDAQAARSSLNRIKEALFDGRDAASRARGEMVKGLAEALADDLEAALRSADPADSCALADVLDLSDIAQTAGDD